MPVHTNHTYLDQSPPTCRCMEGWQKTKEPRVNSCGHMRMFEADNEAVRRWCHPLFHHAVSKENTYAIPSYTVFKEWFFFYTKIV